jgi:hypothetical protein
MLRYLRRVDDLTTGKLRWGILTNGARWRLYYQGVRSVSEHFFELDLAAALGIPGHDGGLFAPTEPERRHWLKVYPNSGNAEWRAVLHRDCVGLLASLRCLPFIEGVNGEDTAAPSVAVPERRKLRDRF